MTLFKDGKKTALSPEEFRLLDPSSPNTFGVFETIRVQDRIGNPALLSRHWKRLFHSMKILNFSSPYPLSDLQEFFHGSLQESPEQAPFRVKCVLTPEHVYIQVEELRVDGAIYNGVSVIGVQAHRLNPKAKALPYDVSYRAHAQAEAQGAYDAFLFEEDQTLTEGAHSNVFWVKNGQVYTRKDGVLPGITRQRVLEACANQKIPVRFGIITLPELLKVDEVFLTKSTTGLVPVSSINGHPLPAARPIARKITQALRSI